MDRVLDADMLDGEEGLHRKVGLSDLLQSEHCYYFVRSLFVI
jgi:hypothetical protein